MEWTLRGFIAQRPLHRSVRHLSTGRYLLSLVFQSSQQFLRLIDIFQNCAQLLLNHVDLFERKRAFYYWHPRRYERINRGHTGKFATYSSIQFLK